MKKIAIILSLILGVAVAAQTVDAQVYYSNYGSMYGTAYTTTAAPVCVTLSRNLSYGMSDFTSGSEVTLLQLFLMSQNYLSKVSSTGYFGGATLKAVKEFQFDHDLPGTGTVGPLTRAAIKQQSCGNTGYNNNYNYNYNNYPVFISSLSTNAAQVGSSVTIYGSGFDTYSSNTVNFGSQSISGLSSNGSSITFTVPQNYNYNNQYCYTTYPYQCNQNYQTTGTIQITVSNSRGTSNPVNFTIGNNYYNNNYYGSPVISSVNPNTVTVGSTVTIYGSNFSSYGNTVYFGGQAVSNVSSYNGTSMTVLVPSMSCSYSNCNNNYTYNVYVTNANGYSSNSVSVNVSSYGYNYNNGTLGIGSISGPTSVTTGNSNVWSFVVTNSNSNYITTNVRWGDENTYGYTTQQSSQSTYVQGSQTVSFAHTYQTPGTYTIIFTVTDNNGMQNTASITVTVAGYSTNQLNLSYLSPNQGRVGTQIMLQGSGFTSYNNVVHFGNGGAKNVSSTNNGSTLYFTIPSGISPCDVNTSGYCALYLQQVTPGTYPVYVVNGNGQQTNTLYFTVTY